MTWWRGGAAFAGRFVVSFADAPTAATADLPCPALLPLRSWLQNAGMLHNIASWYPHRCALVYSIAHLLAHCGEAGGRCIAALPLHWSLPQDMLA